MSSHLFSTAVLLCWAQVGPLLGTCWLHVGPMLGHLGPMLPMMGLYGRFGKHVGPMLGQVGPILGLCWASVGPMLGHVEPKFGNFADFRSLKILENTGF